MRRIVLHMLAVAALLFLNLRTALASGPQDTLYMKLTVDASEYEVTGTSIKALLQHAVATEQPTNVQLMLRMVKITEGSLL